MSADVVVYSGRLCGYCHAAKSLLSAKGVPFREVMVDSDPALRKEIMARSGQRTVPQIWIGTTHVGGFTDLQALARSGELDKLLQQEA